MRSTLTGPGSSGRKPRNCSALLEIGKDGDDFQQSGHEIRARFCFQASYVATAVREETGLTVGDWLREHRMAEARRRLLETTTSVEPIASQVGYSDVPSFHRNVVGPGADRAPRA